MNRRFFASVLAALTLAGGYQVSTAAQQTGVYLVCELKDGSEVLIVIENFGGLQGAVKQCKQFWKGRPTGTTN